MKKRKSKVIGAAVLIAGVAAVSALAEAPLEIRPQSPLSAQGASPDSYEHFLYFRHDLADGVAKTDSLVLVRVRRDGFDAKPVYSELNLHVDWHPLGVRNGKLYSVRMGVLIAVDLNRGTASEVDYGIKSWTWSDGKLYAFVVREAPSYQASLLRVYDADTESYRDIGVPPHPPEGIYWQGWPPKLQVSPDHKWLGYFWQGTNVFSHTKHLIIVAVADGTSRLTDVSATARTFITGSGSVSDGPPFCWLDSKTLLVVRDVSTNLYSMFWGKSEGSMPEMILSRVDINADRMTDLCRLPQFEPYIGEPFFRIGHKGEAPRLVIGRRGQYRIDLAERRLVQDDDIGGGYRYTRGNSAELPDELRFKERLLESEFVIPEIAASPDGRWVAWHARPVIRPAYDADASRIRFHDTVSGQTHTVAPEWIPDAWNVERPSYEGNLFWVSARDLTPSIRTDVPAGWKRFSPESHVEGVPSGWTAR